jgi:hypothetical protein
MAPGLVQAYQKFKNQDVAFVSLTNMREESVKMFVEQNAIPWPAAYETTPKTLTDLGAYVTGRMKGYEANPILYLVGPDGLILWSDEQARLRHEDSSRMLQDLEAAITRALAKS